MQCPHCSEKIPTDSVFCPECGKKIVAKSPASATAAAKPAQDRPATGAPARAMARSASTTPAAVHSNPPVRASSKGLWLAIAVIAAVGTIYMLANLGGSTDDPPADSDGGDHPYRLVAEERTEAASIEFDAVPGDRIVVRAEALDEGADPVVVLTSGGTVIGENDNESDDTLNAAISLIAESEGAFVAEVRPRNEDNPRQILFTVELNP